MKNFLTLIVLFFALAWSMDASAQQLVYKARNPAFGGDTFNYQWLLSSATAQNKTKDPNPDDRFGFGTNNGTDLNDFSNALNQQILNQLTRQLVNDQFGEGGLEDGNYNIGDFQIDIATTVDGVVVTILDAALGEQTQLIVPFF